MLNARRRSLLAAALALAVAAIGRREGLVRDAAARAGLRGSVDAP